MRGGFLVASLLLTFLLVISAREEEEERWDEDFPGTPPMMETAKRYSGHSLVRFSVANPKHKAALDDAVERHGLDVWAEVPGRHSTVRIPPLVLVETFGVPHKVLNEDLESALIEERQSTKTGGFHGKYNTAEDISSYLKSLVEQNKDFMSSEHLGSTLQGRPITVVHVHAAGDDSSKAPVVFIQAGQHAREWIAPAASLSALDKAVGQAKEKGGLDGYQLSMVLLANPDGYAHSISKDRMWRKNLDPNGKSKKQMTLLESQTSNSYDKANCLGVDLNRNWDVKWGQTMTENGVNKDSRKQCSDTFPGNKAATEPEVDAISKYVGSISPRAIAFVDVHSYSEKILPPGCNGFEIPAEDAKEHLAMGKRMAKAMNLAAGGNYQTGPCGKEMYVCSGTAGDWAYHNAKIKHSYSVEVRPTNSEANDDFNYNGFVIPPREIEPTGKEIFAMIETLADSSDLKDSERHHDESEETQRDEREHGHEGD